MVATTQMVEANPVAFYQNISDPMQAVRELGDALAAAQFLGCSNKEQGRIMAWECLVNRISPLSVTASYHIIHGKLSMKSDAMLARFNAAGGTHKIKSRTADLAEIEVTYNGETNVFSLSWDELKQEPTPYNGKEADIVANLLKGAQPALKPKYATPRSRMQMMWARVVSDAIRAVFPQVNSGVYTPEETEDFAGVTLEGAAVQAASTEKANAAAEAVMSKLFPEGNVIEGKVATADEPAKQETKKPTEENVKAEKPTEQPTECTRDQAITINVLFDSLQIPPQKREELLKRRKVSAVRSLTFEQAAEIIERLEAKKQEVLAQRASESAVTTEVAEQSQEESASVGELANEDAPSPADPPECFLASAEELALCRTLLTEQKQRDPMINQKVKAKMKVELSAEKLDALTSHDIQLLISDIQNKTQNFFAAKLKNAIPF